MSAASQLKMIQRPSQSTMNTGVTAAVDAANSRCFMHVVCQLRLQTANISSRLWELLQGLFQATKHHFEWPHGGVVST
jgi:hypothetical protein